MENNNKRYLRSVILRRSQSNGSCDCDSVKFDGEVAASDKGGRKPTTCDDYETSGSRVSMARAAADVDGEGDCEGD